MKCPKCGSMNVHVSDVRFRAQGTKKHRRRECNDCGQRFTTIETYIRENEYERGWKDAIKHVLEIVKTTEVKRDVNEATDNSIQSRP